LYSKDGQINKQPGVAALSEITDGASASPSTSSPAAATMVLKGETKRAMPLGEIARGVKLEDMRHM
jgi:phosphotransacetylase